MWALKSVTAGGLCMKVKISYFWDPTKWSLQRGGLCTEVKIISKGALGSQPSGLYREVVSGYRWSVFKTGFTVLLTNVQLTST